GVPHFDELRLDFAGTGSQLPGDVRPPTQDPSVFGRGTAVAGSEAQVRDPGERTVRVEDRLRRRDGCARSAGAQLALEVVAPAVDARVGDGAGVRRARRHQSDIGQRARPVRAEDPGREGREPRRLAVADLPLRVVAPAVDVAGIDDGAGELVTDRDMGHAQKGGYFRRWSRPERTASRASSKVIARSHTVSKVMRRASASAGCSTTIIVASAPDATGSSRANITSDRSTSAIFSGSSSTKRASSPASMKRRIPSTVAGSDSSSIS